MTKETTRKKAPEPTTASPVATALRRSTTPAAVLLCVALLGWTQFSFDGLKDSDSYFHTRAARELDQYGFRKEFPQTVHSTWSDRYSDKDLLFHVLLIPFQRLHHARADHPTEDLVTPGKQAVVFFDLLLFASLAVALRAAGARFAWLWIILYFAADMPLLYRFLLVRPGLLGVALVLLEIALILKGKNLWLGVVGALHALSHSSFVLLPALALATIVARLLRRDPFPRRLLIAALAGPLIGFGLNPYFPNNFYVAWDQLVEVGTAVWLGGTEIPTELFGSELLATKTNLFLGSYPAFLPAASGIVAFLAFPRRRLSTDGLALVLMSGLLLVAGFLSERFLAFFFPAAVLLGARLWAEIQGPQGLTESRRRSPPAFFSAVALLALSLAAGLADGSVFSLRARVRGTNPAEALRPAIEFLDREARPEELVYHNFWWEFSVLYHYRPRGRYVVALDPVFFYRHDPDLFRKSLAAYRGRSDDLFRVLAEDFGARWVFLPKSPRYYPFFELLRRDSRFERAYEDQTTLIARLP